MLLKVNKGIYFHFFSETKIKGKTPQNGLFLLPLFEEKKLIKLFFFMIVCDNGWRAYKNHCYWFSDDKAVFSNAVVSWLHMYFDST